MAQQSISTDVTSDDKLWAALGYPFGIIALIMLFIEGKKDRPFIKYHAIQALGLTVVFVVAAIVIFILSTVLAAVTFGIGGALACLTFLLWLVFIWPAVLAYQGKYFEVPVVTKFLRGQHWLA